MNSYIGQKPTGIDKDIDINKYAYKVGKVIDVILNSNHLDYKKLGGYGALGAVKYELLDDTPTVNKNTLTYALPLLPFIKYYPLIGETILIFNGLPTINSGNKNVVGFPYYISSINLYNTPHINFLGKPYKENPYFKEKAEFHPLLAKEGDLIIEGRNNQSVRFTSDKEGNPQLIIRATNKFPKQSDKNSFIEESVNSDDTIMIFSPKGKIPLDVAFGSLKSYKINITKPSVNIVTTDNTNKSSGDVSKSSSDKAVLSPIQDVKVTEKEKELFQIQLEEVVVKGKRLPSISEQDDFNVPEYTFLESDKLGLEIIPIADDKAFSTYIYEETLNNGITPNIEIDLEKTPNSANITTGTVSVISQGNFEANCGGIDNPNIPIQAKAMLEVISFCEGTMGRGENGYNILQMIPTTNQLAFIADWNSSDSYQAGHPNQREVVYKNTKTGKVEYIKLKSTASGRYQFINSTWNSTAAMTKYNRFTKSNQNLNCNYLLKGCVGDVFYSKLDTILLDDNNIKGLENVVMKLSKTWDCFPNGNSIYSYHNENEVQAKYRQKCRFTMYDVRNLFKRAYNVYLNKTNS